MMKTSESYSRLRLRHPKLKDAAVAGKLLRAIGPMHGIGKTEMNPRVGSLLVKFKEERVAADTLLDRMSEAAGADCRRWVAGAPGPRPGKPKVKRWLKLGLMASLGGTVGLLPLSGRAHALAGTVLLCCIAAHGYQHRRTFLH